MGFEHGLKALGCGCFALCLATQSACSDAHHEEQRKLLAPSRDYAAKQREAIEKARVVNQSGDLVASELKVAGVNLPRGLTPRWTRPHEWFYDGPFSVEQVDKYFRTQLDVGAVNHPDNVTNEYVAVTPKATPGQHPITLSIFPVPGSPGRTRIDLREPAPPMQQVLTPEQVQAQMEARSRVAE